MKTPIYLTNRYHVARKAGDTLIVGRRKPGSDKDQDQEAYPINTVDYIVRFGSARITDSAYILFSNHSIPVVWSSFGGKLINLTMPPFSNINKVRLRQHKAYLDKDLRLKLAKHFVEEGTKNKIALLKKYKKSTEKIAGYFYKIKAAKNVDSLRGTEGAIAREYFSGLKGCFKHFEFTGREYNLPKDPINALLSFGYNMLYAEITCRVFSHFLDPFLGFLHEQNDAQVLLTYDFSEIYKQDVDAFILKMVNLRQIKESYFTYKPDGNCLLNTYGKNFFLNEWIKFIRKAKDGTNFSGRINRKVLEIRNEIECNT